MNKKHQKTAVFQRSACAPLREASESLSSKMLSSLEAVNWDHSGIAPALEIAE